MAEEDHENRDSQLSADFSSSEVAATLWCHIAEASADAAEMAGRIMVANVRTAINRCQAPRNDRKSGEQKIPLPNE